MKTFASAAPPTTSQPGQLEVALQSECNQFYIDHATSHRAAICAMLSAGV